MATQSHQSSSWWISRSWRCVRACVHACLWLPVWLQWLPILTTPQRRSFGSRNFDPYFRLHGQICFVDPAGAATANQTHRCVDAFHAERPARHAIVDAGLRQVDNRAHGLGGRTGTRLIYTAEKAGSITNTLAGARLLDFPQCPGSTSFFASGYGYIRRHL